MAPAWLTFANVRTRVTQVGIIFVLVRSVFAALFITWLLGRFYFATFTSFLGIISFLAISATFGMFRGIVSAIVGGILLLAELGISVLQVLLPLALIFQYYIDAAKKPVYDYKNEYYGLIAFTVISAATGLVVVLNVILYIISILKTKYSCKDSLFLVLPPPKEGSLNYQKLASEWDPTVPLADQIEVTNIDQKKKTEQKKKTSIPFVIFIVLLVAVVLLTCVASLAFIPFMGGANLDDYDDCDPIDDSKCAYPYPSSYYLKTDNTETGFRVNFGPKSLPIFRYKLRPSHEYVNERDGFSTASTLICALESATTTGLMDYKSINNYNNPHVKSVLINLKDNSLVPHFIELDMTDKNNNNRPFLIQPTILLNYNTKYFFAIRGVVDNDGRTLPRKPSFAKFLTSNDVRAAKYQNEYVPILLNLGWTEEEVQIAWDFHTASENNGIQRNKYLRDDLLTRLEKKLDYEFVRIETNTCGDNDITWKTLHGVMHIPLYVSKRNARMNVRLTTKQEDVKPSKESHPVSFIMQVPCSLYKEPEKAKIVQLGIGFLADRSEQRQDFLRNFAHQTKSIIFSTEWFTLSRYDMIPLASMIFSHVNQFDAVIDNMLQGHLNQYALAYLMQNRLNNEKELTVNNIPLLPQSNDKFSYIGSSLGGITGAGYVSLNSNIDRVYFTVPSAGFAITCMRSGLFYTFDIAFQLAIHNDRDIRFYMSFLQNLMDSVETSGWLNELKGKQLFIQAGIDDSHVHNIQTHLMLRSLGAKLLEKPYRPVADLTNTQNPADTKTVIPTIEWKYKKTAELPLTNEIITSTSGSPHNCVRCEPAAVQMMTEYLQTGTVNNACPDGGPCEAEECVHRCSSSE